MTPISKSEIDPYFLNQSYLADIYHFLQNNNIEKAMSIIHEAKRLDPKFYEGDFPYFEEVLTLLEESQNFQQAKNLILEIKDNKKLFFNRNYLRLFEINKILGHKKENKPLILEARKYDQDYFLKHGYKKLIEILLEEGKYVSVLNIIEAARVSQISILDPAKIKDIKKLPVHLQKNYILDFSDYYLKLELERKIRQGL